MTTFTHTLVPVELPADARILQPPRGPLERVKADSPALSVMTDLSTVRMITIDPAVSVDTALAVMIHAKVRLLLVLEADGAISGLVSAPDLMGEKPLRIASEERVPHSEVRVSQVMIRGREIQPLDYVHIANSTVRDVVRYMLERNQQHALVVGDSATAGRWIARGLFSLSQIGRQMGCSLDPLEGPAESFSELERLIA